MQLCSATPHFVHVPPASTGSASRLPQREQRKTSCELIRFGVFGPFSLCSCRPGARGSAGFGADFSRGSRSRASSMYPRCRYLRSLISLLFCHIVSRTSAFLAALGAVTVLSAPRLGSGQAQEPRRTAPVEGPAMSLVQLAELPRIVDPQFCPDGKSVAYMLGTADWSVGRLTYHLCRQDLGATPKPLTTGAPGDIPGATRWSPDGASIAFLRGGQIWIVAAAGGSARAVTKHATGISNNPGPTWSPDGKTLYFAATDPQTPEERERERPRDDRVDFEENFKVRQLWSIDVASGAEKQLTTDKLHLAWYRLSADGSLMLLERATTPFTNDEHRGEGGAMRGEGSGARQLTHNDVEEVQPALSPDNTQLLFIAAANAKFERDHNNALFVMPVSGGAAKPASPDFPYAIDQAQWAPDGTSILAVANMGVHSEIFRIDVATRTATQLTEGNHYIPTFAIVPSADMMLLQVDEPTRYGDAYTMPISATEGPRRRSAW